MDSMTFGTGPLQTTNGATVSVSDHMLAALERMRPALIAVAMCRGKLTYAQLTKAAGDPYLARGLGPALDALSEDCRRRGEPCLDALVVRNDTGEVGEAFVGDPDSVRDDLYSLWAAPLAPPS